MQSIRFLRCELDAMDIHESRSRIRHCEMVHTVAVCVLYMTPRTVIASAVCEAISLPAWLRRNVMSSDALDKIGKILKVNGLTLEDMMERGRETRGSIIAKKYPRLAKQKRKK